MLFFEPVFLLAFLPLTYIAVALVRRRKLARLAVLLAASLVFYLWAQPLFVPVLFASCLLDYGLGRLASRGRSAARAAVAACVVSNLAVLFYYKYLPFAVSNLDWLLAVMGQRQVALVNAALPIEVSFVVFAKII